MNGFRDILRRTKTATFRLYKQIGRVDGATSPACALALRSHSQ